MPTFGPSTNRLTELLQLTSWRHLNGIAWHARFSYHHKQSRAKFTTDLAAHLIKRNIVKHLLDSLPESAQELLKLLLEGEGSIKGSQLTSSSGKIRSLVYSRVSLAPWREPQNDSEALVYRGLLLRAGKEQDYLIPVELIPNLRHLLFGEQQSFKVESHKGPLDHIEALRHDLLIFALYCQKHLPKVLKGRRLSITVVRHLAARLASVADVENARSHRQVPRLWFISELALAAELIEANSSRHFAPTPVALNWLSSSRSQQLIHLLMHWQPLASLTWPPEDWSALERQNWQITEGFDETLILKLTHLQANGMKRTYWENQAPTFLQLTEVGQIEPPSIEQQAEAQHLFTTPLLTQLKALGVIETDISGQMLRLSSLGTFWLTLKRADELTIEKKAEIKQQSALLLPMKEPSAWKREGDKLLIPWPPDFSTLWRLVPFVNLNSGGAVLEFELTSHTVAFGHSRGYPLAALRHALTAGSLNLSQDLLPSYPAPRVKTGYWLETSTPTQMYQLRQERAIRYALRGSKSIDPRRVSLDPRYLGSLQKALLELGQPAIFDIPPSDESESIRQIFENLASPPPIRLPHSAFLLLAVRLWQQEITRIDKTYPRVERTLPYIPPELIKALKKSLTRTEHAAVEQIWRETLEKLNPSPRNYSPVEAESDDGIRHLTPLQDAIDRVLPVKITYEPAGKETSERIVEPHYLSQKRHLWYLHAYCRSSQDNRHFRLDRIRELTIIELPKRRR